MWTKFETPIGTYYLACDAKGITDLGLINDFHMPRIEHLGTELEGNYAESELLAEAKKQVLDYFDGKRKVFELPLSYCSTPFREAAWEVLLTIPYGQTISYGELAQRLGRPKGARAAGGAIHHNPIAIIIPCHRIIGANGSLTGYADGIEVKKALLDIESIPYK